MIKRPFLFAVSLTFLFIVIAFLFVISYTGNRKADYSYINPMVILETEEKKVEFNDELTADHINYLLNELEVYKLHNPPLSKDTPKLEVKIDNEYWSVEIVDNKLITKKGRIENADIQLVTTKQEVVNALNSDDSLDYFRDSFARLNSWIELNAGFTKLFFKGYYGLYKRMTREGTTGSLIRFFSQG